jgi:NAD+ kinase
MKIAIYSQFYKNKSLDSFLKLLEVLNKKSFEVFVEADFFAEINKNSYLELDTFTVLDNSYDLLISVGGDGTILRAVTFLKDLDIPLIGVNTGRLGFLATIQANEIQDAIDAILNKDYNISERSLLEIYTSPDTESIGDLNFALNEIAVSRKDTTSMITVETSLNGEYLTSYWSDGLIVSTPTGSTGYSLSCGGPVITPNTSSLILTPIAPHNLSARPLVIKDDMEITLKVSGREKKYLVSLDSRIATLEEDTMITIRKAPFKIKMIELNHESFLKTLRKKLLWGEDKRN